MKKYINWEYIKNLTQYDFAIKTVNNYWYRLAEGYTLLDEKEYRIINQQLKQSLPLGWDAYLDINGNLSATFNIPSHKRTLVFYKWNHGHGYTYFY